MAKDVILPALGMSQDTGKIVQWLKVEGEHVTKGEPLAEIETDKATVEIEAPADGVLACVSASAGDDVPVGQVIALILSVGEVLPGVEALREEPRVSPSSSVAPVNNPNPISAPTLTDSQPLPETATRPMMAASMLASRIAADHNIDLSLVKPAGKRIQKADVLAYLQSQQSPAVSPRLVMASPKARRLAAEGRKDLVAIRGSGPGGAILAADVLGWSGAINRARTVGGVNAAPTGANGAKDPALSTTWRVMAERTTQSWTDVPHFYLTREVNATRLISWREHIVGARFIAPASTPPTLTPPSTIKITYTDLLVKIVAAALRIHPRLNASWSADKIALQPEIHIGLAVAIEDGLVVPVIHQADTLSLDEIAHQRVELVAKAQAGKLRPADISGGTFTISNLGMYNVDSFNAIINQPQAAILAVGRIAERVVAVHGQPSVQPMMILTLSCDHRTVDGARGARFLDSVAKLIEEPLGLLT
jgi:pyruvate dehydrogenase E2 component (dihydrolipoamide acetyltransferase)